jgi:hypothetical protein
MRKIYNNVRYPLDSRLKFEIKKWRQPVHLWRIRKVIHRSGGIMRGKFVSFKNGRTIHWESQLERDAVYLFEYSPGVVRYREQPFTCWYVHGDKTRRYTVDFEVEFSDGTIVYFEIKPAEKLLKPDYQEKFKAIQQHFNNNGLVFRILTDKEIRQPVLLDNFKLLGRHGSSRLNAYQRRIMCAKLSKLPLLSFSAIADYLKGKCRVWRLIHDRILLCDLRVPVTENTVFTINMEDCDDDALYF